MDFCLRLSFNKVSGHIVTVVRKLRDLVSGGKWLVFSKALQFGPRSIFKDPVP